MLSQTLEDRRMSRSERRALRQVLNDAMLSDDELAIARALAFSLAREADLDPRAKQVLAWLEEAIKLLIPGERERSIAEARFSPGPECRNAVRHLFREAKTSAEVCVFTITDDGIADEILSAHQRGVSVRIVSDDLKSEDLGSDIARLSDAGIAVRSDDSDHHMHHKFAIFDGAKLATGSYNWTRSAARYNQENLVVTDDPRLVRPFRSTFEALWSEFGELFSVPRGSR